MNTKIQTSTAYILLAMIGFQILPRVAIAGNDDLIYPLKKISSLECRFEDYDTLSGNCVQDLPILKTKDYNTYASQNGWYNDYTRIYTVLWGASYKYGWDVWSGWHQGTDIATAKGTPVYAIADGKVITAGEDIGWGKHVSIEHTIRDKKVVSNYAHLSEILVEKWDSISSGKVIGKVGSTGNSSGNHLHFQIDLPQKFHPYYYDYTACPYSYYDITEKGVCFDELQKNTIDPLLFLESNGAIIDSVKTNNTSSVVKINSTTTSQVLPSIFDITVYHGYGNSENIKEVQQVMKDLWYYSGKITGDYTDIEASILSYQLATGVIQEKTDDGAGWFGPKTRAQAKSDYLALGKTPKTTTVVSTPQTVTPKVETVSREKLMTREEIEAREVQEFLDSYQINFINSISQLSQWETKNTTMKVETSRGKGFKGNVPGNISFDYDESKVAVFPKSFYNFSDGQREISITGKAAGHSTISVKIGDVIVKTFSVSVGKSGDTPKVESAKIYTAKEVVLWEATPAIVLLKDQYGNKMVRNPFQWEFSIESDKRISYCIKRGMIADITALYKRPCLEEEFQDTLSFDYEDTIAWLLVFEYKIYDQSAANLKLSSKGQNKELTKNTLKVQTPKGLVQNSPYYDAIVQGLQSEILTGINAGYFLEERNLTKSQAIDWIANTLEKSPNTQDTLSALKKEAWGKFETLTRKEFLALTQKYLWNQNSSKVKEYRDLDPELELLVANTVGYEYQWGDDFWENYFQPDKKITRGEAAYFLTQALKTQGKWALVRK